MTGYNLIGYMCSGKSTVMQAAKQAGWLVLEEEPIHNAVKTLICGRPDIPSKDMCLDDRYRYRDARGYFFGCEEDGNKWMREIATDTVVNNPRRKVIAQLWFPPLDPPWINVILRIRRPECILHCRHSAFHKPADHFIGMDRLFDQASPYNTILIDTVEELEEWCSNVGLTLKPQLPTEG